MQKISIIGAGHGGLALAAHFATYGAQVTLCAELDHLGFSKAVINNGNNITIKNHITNKLTTATIFEVTHDYKTALYNSDIIYIVTPSFAHEVVFIKVLPYIENRHKIITLAGNFSSIIFNNILQKSDIHKQCLLADISSLPYACRVDSTGSTVDIFGIKNQMGIAAIPALRTNEILESLRKNFPTKLMAYKNPLELGLNITSGISHTIPAIFNAGRIGKGKEKFYFYREGVSEHTSVLLEQLDHDRQYIGSLYNLKLPKYLDLMDEFYGNRYQSIYEFFTKTPVHNAQKLCPNSLSERYVSQDIPYVIVPWYVLGKAKGFESVIMRNLIEIASLINNKDYLNIGLNEEKLMPINSYSSDFIYGIERGCIRCFPSAA